MRRDGARPGAVFAGAFLAGLLVVAGLRTAPAAWAYWTDSGTLTSGAVTTWALTDVRCPNPTWGNPTVLSWSAPAGSVATISLTVNIPPSSLFGFGSSWQQATPQPLSPQTTTATSTQWGISTTNPAEATDFQGTWTLTVTPPEPSGGWSATRTGTWRIHYPAGGDLTCTVNP